MNHEPRTTVCVDLFGFRVAVQSELARDDPLLALVGRRWERATSYRGHPAGNRGRRDAGGTRTGPDLVIRFVRRLPRAGVYRGRVVAGCGFQLWLKQRVAWLVVRRGGNREAERTRWVRTALFMLHLLDETGHLGGRRRVVGLHASAVATPKGALVFCGYSGYGKSTIAGRLLRRHRLLADDWTTLLWASGSAKERGKLFCCDVPGYVQQVFRGTGRATPRPLRRGVAGVFWLAQSERSGLAPVSRAGAAAQMLAPVQGGVSPATVRRRLRLLGEALRMAPCRRLEFRRDGRGLAALLRQGGFV